jgi:hypothetical protein
LVAVLSDSGVDSRYLEDIVAGALRYAGVNAFAVDRGRIVIDEF